MEFDLIVSGGTIVLPGSGLHVADLAVSDGRVAALLPRNSGAAARERIDATGKYLFPGVVDCHTHVELGPGEERWRETRSAAIGGVTTLFTYLLTARPYDQVYPEEREKAGADSVVDYGFHFSVATAEHVGGLDQYIGEYGVTSFKHFTNFRGNAGAYLGLSGTDDGHLWAILQRIARYPQAILTVHCENQDIFESLTPPLQAEGRADLAAHTDSRPDFVEAVAINSALFLARVSGARVYIPHLTCALGLDVFMRERELNGKIYVETCPQYLTHTMYSPIGALGKINPPLRTERDIAALWSAVANGCIDVISSDHVPRRKEKKEGGIWKASAGSAGLATLLPVMLSEGHHRRGIDIDRIAQLLCRRPAEIFGVYPKKGTLLPGSDADVAIVDLEQERTVTAAELGSFCDYTIYEGWKIRGWPIRTIVRGHTVMLDGRIVAPAGSGQYLRR